MLDLFKFGPTLVVVLHLQRTTKAADLTISPSDAAAQLSDRATAPPADESVNDR